MNTPILYDYYVHSIGDQKEAAYRAIIPSFNNAIVYGDTLEELEEGVRFTIESEIEELKKKKKPIPEPEKEVNYSGKLLIRITPILHEKLALEAKAARKSINSYVKERLSK